MELHTLTHTDFNVFNVHGLDARMEQLITHVRPKLEQLGHYFSPTLSTLTGNEMFFHVAKHARRTVNPPKDTWVAFSSNKRGYKQLPHFQIGLWESHVFVWFALIYECPIKQAYAVELEKVHKELREEIPPDFVWSVDHTKKDVLKNSELDDEAFLKLVERLKTVKKAELLCGIQIPREEAVSLSENAFIEKIETTFKTVIPLYHLAAHAVC
ncbi:YktB family protein [Bacillus taeanensis]|uniref:UPF0637 protein DS031_10800 n=1 Tax=Bacillus taeanensis TaxID=273032 RepID=A0A366XW74_9BACI|nr:DUF1054 domain-containing protein [Bacillus taeanensis]RBW69405.1 DUF1054 domain-containing protein [Bacillus taeanensis]